MRRDDAKCLIRALIRRRYMDAMKIRRLRMMLDYGVKGMKKGQHIMEGKNVHEDPSSGGNQRRSGTGKKVLKGLAVGAGAVGAGLLAHKLGLGKKALKGAAIAREALKKENRNFTKNFLKEGAKEKAWQAHDFIFGNKYNGTKSAASRLKGAANSAYGKVRSRFSKGKA